MQIKRIWGLLGISVLLLAAGCSTTHNNAATGAGTTNQTVITDMTLGPGDQLEISVWRQPDMTRKVTVSPDGRVFYPPLQDLVVKGMSLTALRDKLQQGLQKFYLDPQVGINVTSLQSQKVYVLGEVNHPGLYYIDPGMDVIGAIAQAGGFTLDAKPETVLLVRGDRSNPTLLSLNIKDVIAKGDVSQSTSLARGDIVYVPETFIADVSRFFKRYSDILYPAVETARGIVIEPDVKNVLQGKSVTSPLVIGH